MHCEIDNTFNYEYVKANLSINNNLYSKDKMSTVKCLIVAIINAMWQWKNQIINSKTWIFPGSFSGKLLYCI